MGSIVMMIYAGMVQEDGSLCVLVLGDSLWDTAVVQGLPLHHSLKIGFANKDSDDLQRLVVFF